MSTARTAHAPIPIQIGDTTVRIPHGVRATISTSDGLRINVVPTKPKTRRPKSSVTSISVPVKNYNHHDLAHLCRLAQVDIAFYLVVGLLVSVLLHAWLG